MQKQWADGPLALLESPRHMLEAQGKKESTAAVVATEMSNVHNAVIRGLNSMILQAPFVTEPADVLDFMEYAFAFCSFLHKHHSSEEVLYFPLVEEATGVPGIMDRNVVQHEEFAPKLHDFEVYVMQIKFGIKKYDSKKFMDLLDGFAPVLVRHLADEITILMELEKFDIDWTPINERLTKHAKASVEMDLEIPFCLVNMDVTYESSLHNDTWPPFPKFVLLFIRLLYVPKRKGAWRFGSCDYNGCPKELPFAPSKAEGT